MEARQRDPAIVIPELRALARGMPCMFRFPGRCNGDWNTTVLCHSNIGRHGKGVGRKAHDIFSAFGCSACHWWIDTGSRGEWSREERETEFLSAMERTWLYLARHGHLRFIP